MADLDLEEELLQVAGRKRPRSGARDLSDDGEAGSSEDIPSNLRACCLKTCFKLESHPCLLEGCSALGTSTREYIWQ